MERIKPEVKSPVQNPLEAPYVRIVKDVVKRRIPEHQRSLGIVLDEINRQVTGEGVFIYESKIEYPGVKFLGLHLSITPDLIAKITGQELPQFSEPDKTRPERQFYFIQPALSPKSQRSGFGSLDVGIDRFIRELPKVVKAIREGKTPPTIDIYMVGDPAAFGGTTTSAFKKDFARHGFETYGKLFAEHMQDVLDPVDLDTSRVVLHGVSIGGVTADRTSRHLTEYIDTRIQRIYDNTGGNHNWLRAPIKALNLGIGMSAELGARFFFGDIKNSAFSKQGEFYKWLAKEKGIETKGSWLLYAMEIVGLGIGTLPDESKRAFERISTPDPININLANLVEVARNGLVDRLLFRRRRVLSERKSGQRSIFATGNHGHNFPWLRSAPKTWGRIMDFVENSHEPI